MAVSRSVLMSTVVIAAACVLLTLSSCNDLGGGSNVDGPPRNTTPVVLEATQPGAAVVADERAVLDYSNASEGYICVMSKLEDITVKVLVNVAGTQYQYTIDSGGYYITIPLSQGSGTYAVGVWQNISGDQYSAVFSQNIDVQLSDVYTPFLYPSQYVSFAAGDGAVKLSQELATGSVTDVDVLNKTYKWVCENITYDTEKAVVLLTASGYLPDNTNTINSQTGICFDYAVLTVSMLRAQQVPAMLVIGYADAAYHAWIEVHCVENGTVSSYDFNGQEWERMDPTFDAAARGTLDLSAVIGNGTNYQPLLYY